MQPLQIIPRKPDPIDPSLLDDSIGVPDQLYKEFNLAQLIEPAN